MAQTEIERAIRRLWGSDVRTLPPFSHTDGQYAKKNLFPTPTGFRVLDRPSINLSLCQMVMFGARSGVGCNEQWLQFGFLDGIQISSFRVLFLFRLICGKGCGPYNDICTVNTSNSTVAPYNTIFPEGKEG